MDKRGLLFGVGAGLLVAASLAGLAHPAQQQAPTVPLTQDQMKAAADAMQMVVLSKEEYEQWQQEKKVHVKPAPTVPQAPQTPKVGQTSVPKSQEPQSPKLDSTKKPEAPVQKENVSTAPPQSQSQPQTPEKSVVPPVVQTPKAPAASAAVAEKTVSITVPYKATAEGVARTLVEAGVLSADNTFVSELRSQNKLDRIRVGTYQIPAAATEADIVKLITTPPKK